MYTHIQCYVVCIYIVRMHIYAICAYGYTYTYIHTHVTKNYSCISIQIFNATRFQLYICCRIKGQLPYFPYKRRFSLHHFTI